MMKMGKVLAERISRGHDAIHAIGYGATLREACEEMERLKIGALMVLAPHAPDQYCGILTERDIIRACARRADLDAVKVNEEMSREMVSAGIEDRVRPVVALMTRKHIRHIPLVEDGRVIALISIRDIMHALDEEKQVTINELSDYVGCSSPNKVY